MIFISLQRTETQVVMRIITIILALLIIGCATPPKPQPKIVHLKFDIDKKLQDKEINITIYVRNKGSD